LTINNFYTMRHLSALLAPISLCLLFSLPALAQNSFQIIGAAGKTDRSNRLIRTTNGDFVMAGKVDNDAVLYRFDCSGQKLDSLRWDLAAPSSFEEFFDVMELPNGEFLAVGTANILTQYNSALAVRVDANMQVLAADTFDVFGKDAALLQLARSKNGTVYVGGTVAGQSLDFSNGFCAAFNPNSLTIKDSVTLFNYGLDRPLSLSVTDDGNLLMSGMAPIGNIFDGEAIIRNRAFVRKFSTSGNLAVGTRGGNWTVQKQVWTRLLQQRSGKPTDGQHHRRRQHFHGRYHPKQHPRPALHAAFAYWRTA
jgi:hypothetical protein